LENQGEERRREVFDALGHPTRIVILKALSEGPMGFADLKKKVHIDSSGHLLHHLNKLNGLIRTDEYGQYCLSDQGTDALFTVQTVEIVAGSGSGSQKTSVRSKGLDGKRILQVVAMGLVLLLVASSATEVYTYNQNKLLQGKIIQRDQTISLLQDLSRIQVVNSTPEAGMGLGLWDSKTPFSFFASITMRIVNPTQYNVTLELYCEEDVTFSGQLSGYQVLNRTADLSVPMNSDATNNFIIYIGGYYADQNAVSATINNYQVSEVWCRVA
jgi:DNA-binding transcriptional ArsR family regulator